MQQKMIPSIGSAPVPTEQCNPKRLWRVLPSKQRISCTTSSLMKRSSPRSIFPQGNKENMQKVVDDLSLVAAAKPLRSCLSVSSLEGSLASRGTETPSRTKSAADPENYGGVPPKSKRSVSFHKVEVRSHGVCVGDNPSPEMGPPISLDWPFDPEEDVRTLDDYESARGRRRRKNEMYIPFRLREARLREEGFSEEEIMKGEAEKNKARMLRNHTKRAAALQPAQEVFESAGRKVKRIVTLSSKKKEQERLWRDAQEIAMKKEWSARLRNDSDKAKNMLKEACQELSLSRSGCVTVTDQASNDSSLTLMLTPALPVAPTEEEKEEHGCENDSENDYDSDEGETV